MTLTPRQLMAYLEITDKLHRKDRALDLLITATGAQGNQKAIEKMLKDLGD